MSCEINITLIGETSLNLHEDFLMAVLLLCNFINGGYHVFNTN